MYLGRVIGRVWASAKNKNLDGLGLRIVQPIDLSLSAKGDAEVAADPFGLGDGEIVWVEGGKEAAYGLPTRYGPSDATIVAKADAVSPSSPTPRRGVLSR